MDLQAVLQQYIEACHIYGSGLEHGEDHKLVNKAYSVIIKNIGILMSSEEGIDLAKAQLYNEDVYVAAMTASLLIFDYKRECKKVLKSVIKNKGVFAFSMEFFYKEWKKGNMKKMY
ncbi:MAG: hypothetical protein IJE14_02855 [Clostridia bacterium]|nr:hypothetical protein [Clostridia bacterium]